MYKEAEKYVGKSIMPLPSRVGSRPHRGMAQDIGAVGHCTGRRRFARHFRIVGQPFGYLRGGPSTLSAQRPLLVPNSDGQDNTSPLAKGADLFKPSCARGDLGRRNDLQVCGSNAGSKQKEHLLGIVLP